MTRCYRAEVATLAGLPAWALHDDTADLHATWLTGAGMLGASLIHHDEELLWQGAGAAEYARERRFMGIPFLHPWANRLSTFGYRSGGHEVTLDRNDPRLLLDANGLPIHGVLSASPDWVVQRHSAGNEGATLVAALDFDLPEFPFPHRVEIGVRLASGALELRTTVSATGTEAVPIAFGFHPYLQIPGVPRAEWEVSFPVRRRLILDRRLIPTGRTEQVDPLVGAIGERTWDDCFDRIDPPGRFELRGSGRTVAIEYGEGFPVAQIFAPPGQEYVCIEPMTAPANALNGPDSALRWVEPGERFTATFRIACE